MANDYAARLSAGLAATDAAFVNLLDVATRDASARDDRDEARLGDATPFTLCPLLNVSSCAPTETAKPGSTLAMVAFNPSARARVERVRVPVSDEAAEGILRVVDARTNRTVPAAILPAPTPRAPLAGPATRQLAFVVELFPFSATTFFLESAARPNATDDASDGELGGELGGERDGVAVHARVVAGVPASGRSSNKVGSTSPSYSSPIDPNVRLDFFVDGVGPVDVAVTFARYRSHAGDDGFSPSGAYVFRPAEQLAETLVPDPSSVVTVETSVVSETRASFDGGWAHLTTRRWAGASHAEIEWTVGPVPVDERGRVGSEIVVRYAADLATRGAWATDANGGDMQTRRRDGREDWTLDATEPVAGNYYPCTSVVAAEDATAGMHVVVDRSQGVASLRDGEIETMVHRRVLRDDGLGVGEALNETRCGCRRCDCEGLTARGTHLLGVVETSENLAAYRALQRDAEYPTVWAFARAKDDASWSRATTRVRPVHPRRERERERRRGRSVRRRRRRRIPAKREFALARGLARGRGVRARKLRARARRARVRRRGSTGLGRDALEAGHVGSVRALSGAGRRSRETDDARGTTHAGRRLPGVEARGRHARADGDQGGGRGVRGSVRRSAAGYEGKMERRERKSAVGLVVSATSACCTVASHVKNVQLREK